MPDKASLGTAAAVAVLLPLGPAVAHAAPAGEQSDPPQGLWGLLGLLGLFGLLGLVRRGPKRNARNPLAGHTGVDEVLAGRGGRHAAPDERPAPDGTAPGDPRMQRGDATGQGAPGAWPVGDQRLDGSPGERGAGPMGGPPVERGTASGGGAALGGQQAARDGAPRPDQRAAAPMGGSQTEDGSSPALGGRAPMHDQRGTHPAENRTAPDPDHGAFPPRGGLPGGGQPADRSGSPAPGERASAPASDLPNGGRQVERPPTVVTDQPTAPAPVGWAQVPSSEAIAAATTPNYAAAYPATAPMGIGASATGLAEPPPEEPPLPTYPDIEPEIEDETLATMPTPRQASPDPFAPPHDGPGARPALAPPHDTTPATPVPSPDAVIPAPEATPAPTPSRDTSAHPYDRTARTTPVPSPGALAPPHHTAPAAPAASPDASAHQENTTTPAKPPPPDTHPRHTTTRAAPAASPDAVTPAPEATPAPTPPADPADSPAPADPQPPAAGVLARFRSALPGSPMDTTPTAPTPVQAYPRTDQDPPPAVPHQGTFAGLPRHPDTATDQVDAGPRHRR